MGAGALLHHGDRLPDVPPDLEVAKKQNRVGDVAEIHRRRGFRPHQAVLCHGEQREDPSVAEVGQQLVKLESEELLLRHRVEVAIETVDDHQAGALALDRIAHRICELSG